MSFYDLFDMNNPNPVLEKFEENFENNLGKLHYLFLMHYSYFNNSLLSRLFCSFFTNAQMMPFPGIVKYKLSLQLSFIVIDNLWQRACFLNQSCSHVSVSLAINYI